MEEFINHVKGASSLTSPGPDGLGYALYASIPSLCQLLHTLYLEIWTTASYPTSWTHTYIKPLPKPGKDHTRKENYRPIHALLNVDYKIFTGIIANRLKQHSQNIFPIHQMGFIAGRSTHMAALTISSIILSSPTPAIVALLDFEKAYDRVSHD